MNGHVTTATPERRAMVTEVFARVDSLDPEALFPYLAEDASLVFGNQPPLVGFDQVRQGSVDFMALIGGISHEILDVWESDGTVIVKLSVTYTRLDGDEVTIPVVTIFAEAAGKIRHYQVYFDLSPVFAASSSS